MEHDVFTLIEDRLPGFSKGKHNIATYLLRNPYEAAFQTAATIGKAVGVSESSVVRFAGDLGFKGFPDFQKALQQVAMKRLHREAPSYSVASTPEEEDDPLVANAANAILHCRRLYLLSNTVGSSLFPYCKLCGDLVGETFIFLTWDSLDTLFRGLSLIEPGDLLLLMIFHEAPPILTFVIEQAETKGAKLLILSDTETPIERNHGDLYLSVPKGRDEPLPDLIPFMTLLRNLFASYLNGKKEAVSKQTKFLEGIRQAYEIYSS